MKITQVYYHQGKFLMLPEGEWPVLIQTNIGGKDNGEKAFNEMESWRYKQSLTSALSKAVPFEDQERIQHIVDEVGLAAKDNVFTIPPTAVEIVDTGCVVQDCPCEFGYKCKFPQRVARIKEDTDPYVKLKPVREFKLAFKPSQPVEEETQEELLVKTLEKAAGFVKQVLPASNLHHEIQEVLAKYHSRKK